LNCVLAWGQNLIPPTHAMIEGIQKNDKNLLWDDLNVLKEKLFVKSRTIEDYQYKSSMSR
jgi:hypothetical protein